MSSCRSARSAPADIRTRTTSRLTKQPAQTSPEHKDRRAAIVANWEYAPAPEARDIVKIADRYGLFIGGKFVEPLSKQRYTTIDPAHEEPLAEVAQAGKADVARAVRAAREAFPRWAKLR